MKKLAETLFVISDACNRAVHRYLQESSVTLRPFCFNVIAVSLNQETF